MALLFQLASGVCHTDLHVRVAPHSSLIMDFLSTLSVRFISAKQLLHVEWFH